MFSPTALADARPTALQYRPDIDGLRGVSVLAVLMYHAQISLFGLPAIPGGFLGVDVFLTISGFVITKAALQEFRLTGRFSLSSFYIRRARRLLPALLAMLVASSVLAWSVLMPSQLIDFSKSIFYAVSFLSNFYWLDTLTAYGAENSQLKPLLHTWTLAVEEQFYIAYPLLLLILLPRSRTFRLTTLTIISLASVAAMFIVAAENWAWSFYSLPTRLWELLLGAGVAIVSSQRLNQISAIWAETSLTLGLILILLPLFFGSLGTLHPGLVTVAITLGTAVTLAVGPRSKHIIGAFNNRVFIYIGLRSYSVYIWHFPIFSFYRNHYYEQPPLSTASLLLITLFLSEVSYRFIETPFRSSRKTKTKQFFGFLVISCAASLVPAGWAIKEGGFKSRFPDLIEIYGQNEFDNTVLKKRSNTIRRNLAMQAGAESLFAHEQNFLWFTDRAETLKVLIVGNSHAKNLFIALHQNKGSFPTMEFAMYRMQIDPQARTITQLTQARNFKAADVVLISTNFREDTIRNDIKALPGFVDIVESMGKTVVLTSNSPQFFNYGSDTVFDRLLKTHQGTVTSSSIDSIYFKALNESVAKINTRLSLFADRRNLLLLDKFDFSCNLIMRSCSGITPDGFKIYFDGEHYTLEGAAYFGKVIQATRWLACIERSPPSIAADNACATLK